MNFLFKIVLALSLVWCITLSVPVFFTQTPHPTLCRELHVHYFSGTISPSSGSNCLRQYIHSSVQRKPKGTVQPEGRFPSSLSTHCCAYWRVNLWVKHHMSVDNLKLLICHKLQLAVKHRCIYPNPNTVEISRSLYIWGLTHTCCTYG